MTRTPLARDVRRGIAQEQQSATISARHLADAARKAPLWLRQQLDWHRARALAAITGMRRCIARPPAEVPYV